MQTKTLTYALLGVLAVAAIAAAEGEYATKTSPTNAATETFGIKIDPAYATIPPGGSATFTIYARAVHEATLALSVGRHTGDGWRAALSTDELEVPGSAHATLTVSAPDRNGTSYAGFEVVATDLATNESHSAFVKVSTDAPSPTPKPAPKPEPIATFYVGITPDAQRAKPGDTVAYRVVVKAREPLTLKLGVGGRLPDGFVATLDNDSIDLARVPCEAAATTAASCSYYVGATTLRVKVPERSPVDGIALEVYAVSASGERHAAHAKLGVSDAPTPAKDDGDLLARLRALEERVRTLEQREKELSAQIQQLQRPRPDAYGDPQATHS